MSDNSGDRHSDTKVNVNRRLGVVENTINESEKHILVCTAVTAGVALFSGELKSYGNLHLAVYRAGDIRESCKGVSLGKRLGFFRISRLKA